MANVINITHLSIPTTKGNCVLTIIDIDSPIEPNNVISVSAPDTPLKCGCVYINNGYSSCLPLSISTISISEDSSSVIRLTYSDSVGGSTTVSVSTGQATVFSPIIRGSNNNCIFVYPPIFSTSNTYVSTFPTDTLVGLWERTFTVTFTGTVNENTIKRATEFVNGLPVPPTDPYANAGDSDTGGGDGTFDGSSDPVDIPSLPTVGATDAGFITLFAPTSAQLHALASYCWSNLFDIDTFKKLFNDPMDCILGLSVVPVSVPTSGAREITVGNIVTTVQMNVASQQYIEVDCGSISFANKYFGSYLDYEPYTKMAIFLPYCGTHQISADDVMGKTITVKYHIDILTGSCIAFVKCGDSVLYEFNGACASNIPVNSLNYSSTIENAIRIAVNIGTTVATAGASAPLSTATEGASAVSTAQNIGRGISLAGSTAEGALSMKPSVSRSGAMGGGVGLLGNQIPYIIITRPRLCKPKNQDHFEGYPSFIYAKVEDLVGQGFTSFTDIIINEEFLTDAEEGELEAILKGGVYL